MCKKLYLIVIVCVFLAIGAKAQRYYPYVHAYSAQTIKEYKENGTVSFKFGYSAGVPFVTPHKTAAGQNAFYLSGFKQNIFYADVAFDENLFVSKGYYGDYVELRWDMVRYTSQVQGFRILRRVLGSGNAFVQVANIGSDNRVWQDQYAESGTMYEYKLIADGIFGVETKFLNMIDGVGFRVPTGTVSGRVTYEGGAAVAGVSIIAETDDKFEQSSVQFTGANPYLVINHLLDDPLFSFESAFTFEGWFRPSSTTNTSTLFEKAGQYKLIHNNGHLSFHALGAQVNLYYTEKVDTFFHVSAVRTPDSLKLIVVYDDYTVYKIATPYSNTTPATSSPIYIGKNAAGGSNFSGYVDELRIWNKALETDQILRDATRYLSGTEDGLTGYYRFSAGIGNLFYDLSRKGFTFNENHGTISSDVVWSDKIPQSRQLAVKGITDANGNYLVSGIPYATDGSTYRLVPVFGVHSFDPNEKLLFVGKGSNTHSGVNFIDIASFKVTGRVKYAGTDFPVEGVNLKVDGKFVVNSDGTLLASDVLGQFSIDVPIGQHYIEIEKQGHVFNDNGRFPANENEYHDFQSSYTFQQPWLDYTTVKVIGKVVGGPREAGKVKGMGKTINNLGNATITLTTQKEKSLNTGTASNTTIIQKKYVDGVETEVKVNGTAVISNVNIGAGAKSLTIKPDPVTGEYVAYLLPERYIITSVIAGDNTDYTFDASYLTTLDLSSSSIQKVEIDSIITGIELQPNGDTTTVYRIDSVNYHKNHDFIYRVKPEVNVTNPEGGVAFWETTVKTKGKDGPVIPVVDTDTGYPLSGWPIFKQRNKYKLKVSVFERYENKDRILIDDVPVSDGKVSIQNYIAINTREQTFDVNKLGEVIYEFTAGLPKISDDFTNLMTITALTGQNNKTATPWVFSPLGGTYSGDFKGYTFGAMPTGSNFVTTGPNKVDMIIRDPQGSNSYAFYEVGNTTTSTTSYDVSNSVTVDGNLEIDLGLKVTTFVGLGAGVINETEIKNNLTVGATYNKSWDSNNSETTTVTNTKKWSTSASEDFVGAAGDVFIGHSTNIVYGLSNRLDLIPKDECQGCLQFDSDYSIGHYYTIRVNPEFGTSFQYSQNHIENFLIPGIKLLRNNFLQSHLSIYSTSLSSSDPKYGERNSTFAPFNYITGEDTISGFDGDNYSVKLFMTNDLSRNWPSATLEFVDSVEFYNKQIDGWHAALRRNEKEKLEATLIENLSFDAGTIYESSVTNGETNTETTTTSFEVSPYISSQIGGSVWGMGLTMNMSETITHGKSKTVTGESTEEITFGFVLEDGDEGDFYSIDVKKPGTTTGPVFRARGGQSSCPYVDADVTKYYNQGTVISEATMRREVPGISAKSSTNLFGVPEDKPAFFSVELINNTESRDHAWFMLTVDQASNPDGALIKVDGAPIQNGVLVYFPPSTPIIKTVSVGKTQDDVNEYKNLRLILHSICQYDPTNSSANIADSLDINVTFIPVCSSVNLAAPLDQWTMNDVASDSLTVKINGYNLQNSTFDHIDFQYKAKSSSLWVTDMSFYVTQTGYDNASEPKTFIDGNTSLDYFFNMTSLIDRQYDVRARSVCTDGTINYSSVKTGIKDVKRPQVFGTPHPGDGILSAGEDVKITFNEPIQGSALTYDNFSVRGVLNGAELQHNSGLFFDGVDDYTNSQAGVRLHDKSFTIEFWTLRDGLVPGTIFNQGGIEIGFTAGNNLFVTLGSETNTTSKTYAFTDKWIHFAISFDIDAKILNLFTAYDGYEDIDLSDVTINGSFLGNGSMYVGKNTDGNSFYNGTIHDLRVWEKALGRGSVNANKDILLVGDESKLIGYWPMTDLRGAIATDLSRGKHLVLNNGVQWKVYPAGFARTFDGNSAVDITTGSSVVITNDMDFTIEFWFRAPDQSETVMFSNGKADGSESPDAYPYIWTIGFNNQGQLYTRNNGVTIIDTQNDYTDNQWHHFALAMKRKGNTNMYVDGKLVDFESSTLLGGLKGANMTIGASRHYSNGAPYERHFNGSIDELRIWELTRSAKLLELDRNSKLTADEKGLVAYYPFEKFNAQLTLVSTLVDCDIDETTDEITGLTGLAIGTGGDFDNTNVPAIKGNRPLQNLAFNWVASADEIVINIDEAPDAIERRVLEFTVDGVEDLNNNTMASPQTWTAYIKRNTVLWDETVVNKVKPVNDPLSFTVDIVNVGGVQEDFSISNLPWWLTVSESSGEIEPLEILTLTFNVDPSLNIGLYEEILYLTTDFGFNEALNLTVKVAGEKPDWDIDPAVFTYSMNVIALVKVDGVVSTDMEDILAAHVNGNIRGVSNLTYIPEYDLYLAMMDIYSNSATGESVAFYMWDASEGKTHTEITPNINFVENKLYGTPSNPLILNAINTVSEPIVLNTGWNWVSFPLNNPNHTQVDKLLGNLNAQEGDVLKGSASFDQYSTTNGWFGNITNNGGVSSQWLYKLRISNDDTLQYVGAKLDPAQINIPIVQGWNWIGFPSLSNMTIKNAFTNYTPDDGDFIKGQNGFAIYDETLGWLGTLTYLKPKKGYMYQSGKSDNLIFPDPNLLKSGKVFVDEVAALYDAYNLNPHQYQYNAAVIAEVDICSPSTVDCKLLAFNKNQLIGVTKIVDGKFYLTLFGNDVYETPVDFKMEDANGVVYDIIEKLEFEPNNLAGKLVTPYQLTTKQTLASLDNNDGITISPTLYDEELTVSLTLGKEQHIRIELYDLTGKKIAVIADEVRTEGSHSITWKVNNLGDAATGVQLMKIRLDDEVVKTQRLVCLPKF